MLFIGLPKGYYLAHNVEQHVTDSLTMLEDESIVKWLLIDDLGVRCVWERPRGSHESPEITQRSPRYKGEWQKGSLETAIA